MKAMDYILADRVIMPPEDAKHCAENVVELSCGLSLCHPKVRQNAALDSPEAVSRQCSSAPADKPMP